MVRRPHKQPLRILVVEDDFTSCLLLQKLLTHYGEVRIAVDGCEAVEAAIAAWDVDQPYDLICLDIMMPEMDGQTALKTLRAHEAARGIEDERQAAIIMTTTLDSLEQLKTAVINACSGYLTKPIDSSALLDLLRKLQLIV